MNCSCYIWNESIARKGTNEVATAILWYLLIQNLKAENVHKVHFSCDRCTGQNCNRVVFVMLSLCLQWFGFEEIALTFLVTGHSHKENDVTGTHSVIETETSLAEVSTTEQWEGIIRTALTKEAIKRKVVLPNLCEKLKPPFSKPMTFWILNLENI